MIRKLIDRVFARRPGVGELPEPCIIPPAGHDIRPERISAGAVMVTGQLQRAGFDAYVVGGAVRDLMLGRKPKDFDVATNATPDEVHALFRRSRIIGRRFQIVHVMHGQEVIEVSTFRASAEPGNGAVADESGRILRDNVFGSQAEDAVRRDFTANALYYDPSTDEVFDYLEGVNDLRRGLLRIIGDPAQRYREDPVRMLRAARLSAKLGLALERKTAEPIAAMAPLLGQVPAARLFDETLKLMLSGHAVASADLLRQYSLHRQVLPMLDSAMQDPVSARFVQLALANTDARIAEAKPVSPAFLLATLMWHEVRAVWQANEADGMRQMPALYEAMESVAERQAGHLAIPRRFTSIMKEIWGLQPRFDQRAGNRPERLLAHPRFRAGYDFLVLRCAAGELDAELGSWWETFQHADERGRQQMLVRDGSGTKRRRPRRRKPVAAPDRQE